MVKPMVVRPRRNQVRFGRIGRRVAWYSSLAALVGGLHAYQDPHIAANLKPLFSRHPHLRVITGGEMRAAPPVAEWFAKNHALPPQDSLSLHIASRHGLYRLSPRVCLTNGELWLFKKIAPDDSHVLAATAVFADLVKELPAHRITPASVDSLLVKKIEAMHPLSVKIAADSPESREAMGRRVLDYYFYDHVAGAYFALSAREKERFAGALQHIRLFR